MTAIRNQRGGVRRGISIAAAALSLALVAPAIQPVVAPQFVATAVAQDASSTSQSVPETNVPANTKHSVKGYTLLQSNGALKDKEDSEYTSPISGVPVYAQWFNAYGEASPVTKGTSDAKGFFSFTLAPFVSQQDGKLQEFVADPNGPSYNKVRVWSPGNADLNAKYDIFSQWNNGKPGPNTDAYNTSEGMGYNIANDTMGDFYIRFKEKTDVKAMVGDAKPAPTNGTRLGGKFAGRVYWENYLAGHVVSNWGAAGSGYYEFDKNKDAPASKIKVYAAYLSDQAIAKINSQETKTALGVTNIRGAGWTAGNERDLQNWIKKQIAKDGADKWLAESYYTETNSDGEFTIQFNGTWGSAWDTTPSVVMSDEAKERLHSVSKTSEDGDWALGLPNSKHVNTEWMFIQTEPIENATVNSPWNFGTYTGNVNAKYGITGFQTQWGVMWGRVSNASNIKIPIMSMNPQLDIVKYDSYENFAAPGDTVATKTTGIALQGKSDQKYQIVWKDAAGNVIKVKDKSGNEQPLESAPLTVGSDGTLPSYPMTVPNDLEKVTTYKAYLYALAPDGSREDAQPLAVDSYTAIPLEKPVYTPKKVEQGKQGVSAAPKFDNLGTKPVETDDNPYPENSHFEIDEANLPEGVSASDVSIDKATGVVTLKKASGKPGSTINIPVKYVVEKALLDENKKPVLRPEYKPGTGDLLPDDQRKPVIAKQVMNTVAPFTITAPTTPAPSVAPGSVV
ncbi:Rib/alpha-like domain-containing protein, partial [Corynebacterium glucuronolyticum]|uniref:Rib/alpha-like domain-containing protein n=1 Tax=Corynebacterium glucuronolyticum TaxID=39791 RepID=UPI0021D5B98D